MNQARFAIVALTITVSTAFATESKTTSVAVEPGAACTQEGQRAYKTVGQNREVYFCKNGVWTFLYLETPEDRNND